MKAGLASCTRPCKNKNTDFNRELAFIFFILNCRILALQCRKLVSATTTRISYRYTYILHLEPLSYHSPIPYLQVITEQNWSSKAAQRFRAAALHMVAHMCQCVCSVASAISDSLRPHGL